MREQKTQALKAPPVQPCCGRRHVLPFWHVYPSQKRNGRPGRTKAECARCWRTRKPGEPIRWAGKDSNYCAACEAAIRDAVNNEHSDTEDVFALIAFNNRDLKDRGWW